MGLKLKICAAAGRHRRRNCMVSSRPGAGTPPVAHQTEHPAVETKKLLANNIMKKKNINGFIVEDGTDLREHIDGYRARRGKTSVCKSRYGKRGEALEHLRRDKRM